RHARAGCVLSGHGRHPLAAERWRPDHPPRAAPRRRCGEPPGRVTDRMSCSACDRIARITEGTNPDFVPPLAEPHVTLAAEQVYRGYCILLLKDHHEHLADLPRDRQARLWEDVALVAAVLRRELAPRRINYACLGNLVTHVHWHVIPRHADD